jgi:hypothetical protein
MVDRRFTRGQIITLGGSAAVGAGAAAIGLPSPVLAARRILPAYQFPPGWSTQISGGTISLLQNGSLVAKVITAQYPDKSYDLFAAGPSPSSPQYGMHFPQSNLQNQPITTDWGYTFNPTSPSTGTYGGQRSAGQGWLNQDSSVTIIDSKLGTQIVRWSGDGPPCRRPPCPEIHIHHDVNWSCVTATAAAEIGSCGLLWSALDALAAAGWILAAIPATVLLGLGLAALGVLGACLTAYAICTNQ